MKSYPFMLGANQSLEYQHIAVAAEFCDAESLHFIALACDDFPVDDGAVYLSTVHSTHGRLSMFFRQRYATLRDLSGDDDIFLGDHSSRRIALTEGVLLQGHHPNFPITKEHLDLARTACLDKFHEFWPAEKWPDTKLPLPPGPLELPDSPKAERLVVTSGDKTPTNVTPPPRKSLAKPHFTDRGIINEFPPEIQQRISQLDGFRDVLDTHEQNRVAKVITKALHKLADITEEITQSKLPPPDE